MNDIRRPSLVKPSVDTHFHIDFEWWSQNDREWRVYLRNLLTEDEQTRFAEIIADDVRVDWVDPETAEVKPVDGLQHILITHTAQQEGFLSAHTALVEAIFRLFLKTGNKPMSAQEIAELLNRPPMTVLKTLSGPRVYRGIRPILG
ncbi:MAG: hypothetical protein HYZ26_06700 [Chloroflexi bacterium]|nr:hypothetical protein [Chloroflexota bacterium]